MKEDLDRFFKKLIDLKRILKKLKKYKKHPHYRFAFLKKVREVNKEYLLIYKKLEQKPNTRVFNLFKKIKGDIETIVEYKNPDTALDTIDYIEDFWIKIEVLFASFFKKEDFYEPCLINFFRDIPYNSINLF